MVTNTPWVLFLKQKKQKLTLAKAFTGTGSSQDGWWDATVRKRQRRARATKATRCKQEAKHTGVILLPSLKQRCLPY